MLAYCSVANSKGCFMGANINHPAGTDTILEVEMEGGWWEECNGQQY